MTITVRDAVKQFISYVERAVYDGVRDPSGPFEVALPARALRGLEIALSAARQEGMVLLTGNVVPAALVGQFLLAQSGLTMNNFIEGFFSDRAEEMVEALVKVIHRFKASPLILETGFLAVPVPGVRYVMLAAGPS